MQIKTRRYHLPFIIQKKKKKTTQKLASAGEDVEKSELTRAVGRDVTCAAAAENSTVVPPKIKNRITI